MHSCRLVFLMFSVGIWNSISIIEFLDDMRIDIGKFAPVFVQAVVKGELASLSQMECGSYCEGFRGVLDEVQ